MTRERAGRDGGIGDRFGGRGPRRLGMLLLPLALLAPLAGARAAAAQETEPTAKAAAFVAQSDGDQDENGGAETEDGAQDDAAAEATEDDVADADADGDADGMVTYESPRYGYTITYDAGEWERSLEDDDPDDVYDLLYLSNGISNLGIFGDPDYAEDDLDACVDDYLAGLEQGERNSDIEPLDGRGDAGEEDDRAWATFAYVLEDGNGNEDDFIRYIECRVLGEGVTLVIAQSTFADEYDDEIAAREDVLERLDAADIRGPDDGADDDRGDDTGDDPAETPEADPDDDDFDDSGDASALDGDWEGESEDGVAFSFVVEDGGVLSVSYGYECDGEAIFAGAAISDSTPIEDGAFVFATESSSGTTTVIGTISADGEAAGTLERAATEADECDVAFEWTAEAA